SATVFVKQPAAQRRKPLPTILAIVISTWGLLCLGASYFPYRRYRLTCARFTPYILSDPVSGLVPSSHLDSQIVLVSATFELEQQKLLRQSSPSPLEDYTWIKRNDARAAPRIPIASRILRKCGLEYRCIDSVDRIRLSTSLFSRLTQAKERLVQILAMSSPMYFRLMHVLQLYHSGVQQIAVERTEGLDRSLVAACLRWRSRVLDNTTRLSGGCYLRPVVGVRAVSGTKKALLRWRMETR
ncbi:unnamed protein product, partial [Mycena citricolor]